MNIDIEKFKEIANYKQKEELRTLLRCEIKPVDCNECMTTRRLESFVCGSCVDYYSHLTSHFKPKTKEWYEKPESFPCLCWISNVDKNPKEYISIIDGHNRKNRGLGAFSLTPGGFVKYASPLTKEEALNYCAGEK